MGDYKRVRRMPLLKWWWLKFFGPKGACLPEEGTRLTILVDYQWSTVVWEGIVEHHEDKEHFILKCETSIFCCIKPINYTYIKL